MSEALYDQVISEVEEYHLKVAKLSTEFSVLKMLQRAKRRHRDLEKEVKNLRGELKEDNSFTARRERYVPIIKSLLSLAERIIGREQKKEVVDTIMELCEKHEGLVDLTSNFKATVRAKVVELIQRHHLSSAVRVFQKYFNHTTEDKAFLVELLRKPTTDIDFSDEAVEQRKRQKMREEEEEEERRRQKEEEEEEELHEEKEEKEEAEKEKEEKENKEPQGLEPRSS